MAAVVAAGISGGVWLVAAMAVYLAGLGLAMPQAIAGALTPFPERAGTASSLMGFVQQGVAAIVTAAVGDYLGPSAWPVAGVVVAMGCVSFLFGLRPAGCASTPFYIGLRHELRLPAAPCLLRWMDRGIYVR